MAAAATSVRQAAFAIPDATVAPAQADGALPDLPALAPTLGGEAARDGLGLALFAIGMTLIALTGLAVLGLVGGRGTSDRWRSALDGTRATRAIGERGLALQALLLVTVSLVWVAIAVWALMR